VLNEKKELHTRIRDEAVKLIVEQGYSYAEVGRNLGVHLNLLSKWYKSMEDDLSPSGKVSMQAELKRLRKENKRLRMEREILKKAAVDSIDQRNTLYYNIKNNMGIANNETNGSTRYVHQPKIRCMASLEER
jgi:transposase